MTKLPLTIFTSILSLLLITGCFCPRPCCPYRPCPPTPCCDMRPNACPLSHCCAKPGGPQPNNGQQTSCPQSHCCPKPGSPQENGNQQTSCSQGSCQENSCQQNNCGQNSCQQNGCNQCRHCVPYRDYPLDPNYHDLD